MSAKSRTLGEKSNVILKEHSIFSVVFTKAVAPYYVEAWKRASVNTLEKIECSLMDNCKKKRNLSTLRTIVYGMDKL